MLLRAWVSYLTEENRIPQYLSRSEDGMGPLGCFAAMQAGGGRGVTLAQRVDFNQRDGSFERVNA